MTRQTPQFRPGSGPEPKETEGEPQNKSKMTRQNWGWVVVAVVCLLTVVTVFGASRNNPPNIAYSSFIAAAADPNPAHQLADVTINNATGEIIGHYRQGGAQFHTTGPAPPNSAETNLIAEHNNIRAVFVNPQTSWLAAVYPFLLVGLFVVGFWLLIRRQAQGQMNGVMSIGRSKAKVYTAERPRTTFADVAGYTGVKQEITEVVEFLRSPQKFTDIGARIPKGILLVGPPGTGKTLLARAVAGEAGVPFLSVTASEFMEMFVGVGASRVRDLFQTARKQAPAIIFIDEIDSIGRKRGAGLGGGHDEREQTLNQMLSEMDGFEATEGVVMIAATNRPDILDSALLRPGRFDRQVVVPLPDLEERLPILQVHCRDKKISSDVDLALVARGTPGMSGADLANLVNEAALHAVRREADSIYMTDFEAARDRVIMGQRRESTVLSIEEKERVAYHEGGHAVLAYVLPNAEPLHKVTILPTGMALGVTQQLPLQERHIYQKVYIEDSLAVRMGGRVAELLVYGDLSTGASNDLLGNTDLARKMVCEWGMSERVGPMAWGSEGQVFLGDDLLHSGNRYSDRTSHTIDEEVQRILRESEERAEEFLALHREGLNAVASALLERETIDGSEVAALVDSAFGGSVHTDETSKRHYTAALLSTSGTGNGGPIGRSTGSAGSTGGVSDDPGTVGT